MKKKIFFVLAYLLFAAPLLAIPQAVVFDFGGVMTGEQNRQAVITFIKNSFHLSDSEYEQVNQEKRAAIKKGKTDEGFWLSYANERGINLPSDWCTSFRAVMIEAIGVNPEMYALVEELKKHQIRVALLSNIDERLSKLIREYGLYEPFNPCILSCEIGVEKPDLNAYRYLLEKLDLSPETVVFIDDKYENIEAAMKMGIDGILFESVCQIYRELGKRGL